MAIGENRKQETRKFPPVLYILDVILAVVITHNMWTFFMNIASLSFDDSNVKIQTLYLLVSSIYLSVSIIFTMMTLQSAKKESWRATARRCFIILVTGYLNEFLSVGTMIMLFEEALIIFIVVYVILFLPSVRRYYTPPLSKEMRIREWIMYILIKPRDWNYIYTFHYR